MPDRVFDGEESRERRDPTSGNVYVYRLGAVEELAKQTALNVDKLESAVLELVRDRKQMEAERARHNTKMTTALQWPIMASTAIQAIVAVILLIHVH